MQYFMDTEFIEDGKTIDLISIAIVSEDSREYYAINSDCDLKKANEWVKDNVIPQLPERYPQSPWDGGSFNHWQLSKLWKPKEQIKREVASFLGCRYNYSLSICENRWQRLLYNIIPFFMLDLFQIQLIKIKFELNHGIEEPEFIGDCCSYDWVVFCQLFGKMIDLPKGFPMYINDIQQLAKSLGNPEIPIQLEGNHDALEDAKHIKKVYEFLREIKKNNLFNGNEK